MEPVRINLDLSTHGTEFVTHFVDFEEASALPVSNEKPESDEEDEEKANKIRDYDDYDFEDPFIDDEEEDHANGDEMVPETEGFFVWKGAVPMVELEIESTATESENNFEEVVRNSPFKVANLEALVQPTPVKAAPEKPLEFDSPYDVVKEKLKKKTDELLDRPATKKVKVEESGELKDVPNLESKQSISSHPSLDDFSIIKPEEKPKKIKKLPAALPEIMQPALDELKAAIEQVGLTKGKFPPLLKQPLMNYISAGMTHLGRGKWEWLHEESSKLMWNWARDLLCFQTLTLKKLVDKVYVPNLIEEKQNALEEIYKKLPEISEKAHILSIQSYNTKLTKWKDEHPSATLDKDGKLIEEKTSENTEIEDADNDKVTDKMSIDQIMNEESTEIVNTDKQETENSKTEVSKKVKKDLPPKKCLIWTSELKNSIYNAALFEFDLVVLKLRSKELFEASSNQPSPMKNRPVSTSAVPEVPGQINFLADIQPSIEFASNTFLQSWKGDVISEKNLKSHVYSHILKYCYKDGAESLMSTGAIGLSYNASRTKEEKETGGRVGLMGSAIGLALFTPIKKKTTTPPNLTNETPQKIKKAKVKKENKEVSISTPNKPDVIL